jgi:hypothetical protein
LVAYVSIEGDDDNDCLSLSTVCLTLVQMDAAMAEAGSITLYIINNAYTIGVPYTVIKPMVIHGTANDITSFGYRPSFSGGDSPCLLMTGLPLLRIENLKLVHNAVSLGNFITVEGDGSCELQKVNVTGLVGMK